MSLSTKEEQLAEIWDGLVTESYPGLEASQRLSLKTFAACDWADGADTDLAKLFDQYVMLKTLKGVGNGNST